MTLKEYINDIGIAFLGLFLLIILNPFNLSLYGGYLFIGLFIVFKLKKNLHLFDSDFVILFIFTATYTGFNFLSDNPGLQYLIMLMIFPPTFYIMGKYLNQKELAEKYKLFLIILIGIVLSFTSLISVMVNIAQQGFVNVERNVPDILTGTSVLATLMAANFIYNLTLPGIIVTNRKNLNLLNIAALSVIFIFSLLSIFRLGGRTGIVILGATFIFSILYRFTKQNVSQNIKFTASLIVLSFLAFKFVPFDLEADYLSVLGDRLTNDTSTSSSSAGGRTDLWSEAFSNIFKHPLGWRSSHFAHNVWLDTARVAGVIPLLFLMIFNFKNVLNLKKLMKDNSGLNVVLMLYTLVNLLVFFVEPILEGSILIFCVFCFFQGFITRTIELKKNDVN